MRLGTLTALLATTVLTAPMHAQGWDLTDISWLPADDFGVFIPDPGPGWTAHPPNRCRCVPMFEDLAPHVPYYHHDVFFSHGLRFEVAPFQWTSGTFFAGGKVFADTAGAACGTGQDLLTNNANVKISFREAIVDNVYWTFGEYGGNINLVINGDFRNVQNYRDLDGMIVGGVLVNILWGGYGNDCGCIALQGPVKKLAIGGQEHWIDCLRWEPGRSLQGERTTPQRKNDVNDLMELVSKLGSNDANSDLDADGVVGVKDLIELLSDMPGEIDIPPEPEFNDKASWERIEPNPSSAPLSSKRK